MAQSLFDAWSLIVGVDSPELPKLAVLALQRSKDYSLINSAKLNGLDPEDCLREVFT